MSEMHCLNTGAKFAGSYGLHPITPEECKKRGLPYHWWNRPYFDFKLDHRHPLTLVTDTFSAQPCMEFVTDGGSIPTLVQLIPAFDRFRYPKAYGFHDNAFKNHIWWVKYPGLPKFVKTEITFVEANYWLREMLLLEGATEATASVVDFFVSTAGRLAW